MLPRPYLVIKETFIVENARRGGMLKRKDVKYGTLVPDQLSRLTNADLLASRKMFRIDPAITTRIYDFLIANEMLFRDEPKSSKPKIAKEDADSSTIESQVPATSETPASVS